MGLNHDLVWQNLGLVHRSSVAYQFARYALGVSYESLPPEVVHHAKRILLDTLGCAIGAFEAPGRPILERAIRKMGGPPESTVFGSGLRTSALNATLINCFLVRYLDYNDHGGGGHNSEAIPPLLAVAERQKKATGRDFLTSLVVSYELGARVIESVIGPRLEQRGWNVDCRTGLSMPAAIGKLMGLSEDQIANAIGVAGAHAPSLGILDADRENMAMAKNLRFGFAAQHAIQACLLCEEGFTGFVRVVEGDRGYQQVLLNGEMDLERLVDFSGWRIMGTSFKSVCQNWGTQAHILATLAIVKEHDLKPGDIASVRIKTSARDVRHVGNLIRKYPKNTETASHSAFFAHAAAIKERGLGPEQMRPEKFNDPLILDLIERITIEVDPSLPEFGVGGASEITTVDGRRFEKRYEVPHGHFSDPLTDAEVEDKFRRSANLHMSAGRVQSIIDAVWRVDELPIVEELTRLMVLE